LYNSKIQYKNFETGEFVEETPRSYESLIKIIEEFPWETQREKIQISLTNPSITIENENQQFLKLALFYNGKFVLHYCDKSNKLFSKSFTSVKDSYSYLKKFYEQDSLDLSDFKHESTILQDNIVHFVSQDFQYTISDEVAFKYLLKSSWMNLASGIFILYGLLDIAFNKPFNPLYLIFIIPIFFLFGGGIHLMLFFKYYLFSKNKILILSKGNDTFYFGNIFSPFQYSKKNIEQVLIYQNNGYRSMISDFVIVKVIFKNKSEITIPSIFVNDVALRNKFSDYPQTEINSGVTRLMRLKEPAQMEN
jgi:hypothetical protein